MFSWFFENLESVKTKFKRIQSIIVLLVSLNFFKIKKKSYCVNFNLFQEHLEPIWYQSTIFWNNSWLLKATLDSPGTSLLFLKPEVTFTIYSVGKKDWISGLHMYIFIVMTCENVSYIAWGYFFLPLQIREQDVLTWLYVFMPLHCFLLLMWTLRTK